LWIPSIKGSVALGISHEKIFNEIKGRLVNNLLNAISPIFVPLSKIATLELKPWPNQISRKDGKRRIVVSTNVLVRDIGSFVIEAQQRILQCVEIPPGYWTTWGGLFERLQSATRRLEVVIPVALLMVFILLFIMFGSLKDGVLEFTVIPFALTGGFIALWLRDIPISIFAAVGFSAMSGVAVLNGLVMTSFSPSLCEYGHTLEDAITEGAMTRLRPVLMTALVASLGFIPMANATETRTEVQLLLAMVVIGCILSSTFLPRLVLPLLYQFAHRKDQDEPGANDKQKMDEERNTYEHHQSRG
jgi:cobalt-zinc-cadmium resistance protein CzcA